MNTYTTKRDIWTLKTLKRAGAKMERESSGKPPEYLKRIEEIKEEVKRLEVIHGNSEAPEIYDGVILV